MRSTATKLPMPSAAPWRRRPCRRGMSMTEVMISLTASSLLLAMAAALIGALLRADAAGRSEQLAASETARLARKFRRDVHAAGRVAPPPAQPDAALLVALPTADGGRVAYRLAGKGIQRIERRDGVVARRDAFTLLPGTTARVDRLETPPGMLRLVVWRAARVSPAPTPADGAAKRAEPADRLMHVEAKLGRDGRFAREVPDAR